MNMLVSSAALVPSIAVAALSEDAHLLMLEERIWKLYELAHERDDDIYRLHIACADRLKELSETCPEMDGQALWKLIVQTPESKEHSRLVKLSDPYHDQLQELVKQMWAVPARTAEGRRAKVEVLLACAMPADWRDHDGDAEWDVKMARDLLFEFVGGEQGIRLRDQFSV